MLDYKKKINRILFELSNLCHFAPVHKKCPLHFSDKPIILPRIIIDHVLETIASWGYKGNISFHAYNEPGIDPRLFMIIAHAKSKCPDSYISIMSNGFYLDENLLSEYRQVGVDEIILSAYSEKDFKRFSSYKTELKVVIQRPELDERLDLYTREKLNLSKPCAAPYNEMVITREGFVGLCCLDWKREQVFGDLHSQTLEKILNSEKMQKANDDLVMGNRVLNICSRCDWSR